MEAKCYSILDCAVHNDVNQYSTPAKASEILDIVLELRLRVAAVVTSRLDSYTHQSLSRGKRKEKNNNKCA